MAGLQLYQRTPPWVAPWPNREIPRIVRRIFEIVPGALLAFRLAIYWSLECIAYGMTKRPVILRAFEALSTYYMRRCVADKSVRRLLTPDYRAGCKRMLYSATYYQAVADTKTELVTDGISGVTPRGILTEDGTEREVDVIVFATGFDAIESHARIDIRGPRGESLIKRWRHEGAVADRGITVADVPNLFLLQGPNTALGHTSVLFMLESQIRYIAKAIARVDKLGARTITPTRDAQKRFNARVQRRLSRSVWNTGGCRSWYLDEHGRNTMLWAGYSWQYRLATRSLKSSEYVFTTARG